MAYDIFAGSYVSAYYSEDLTNTTIAGKDYTEIFEVAAFPESGIEREVITPANYSHKYGRKLVGRASVPSIDMTVNYVPGSSHDKLITACEDGKRIQIKFVYWFDATKTAGTAIVYNGFLSKAVNSGGESDAVTRAFTFEVDGGPVAQGIVDTTESGQ
ncbi:hypothetical protein SRABI106_00028 [Rahnella aquatilis]|nr:hypothetical protein SRABI106_00028 [Rahnella aquatilis]